MNGQQKLRPTILRERPNTERTNWPPEGLYAISILNCGQENIRTMAETDNHKQNNRAQTSRVRLRDSYLKTGKVPFDLMLKKGFTSLLFDPWLTFLKYLEGPVGFKLRQMYWRRKIVFLSKWHILTMA